jgi:hypothetical protein
MMNDEAALPGRPDAKHDLRRAEVSRVVGTAPAEKSA